MATLEDMHPLRTERELWQAAVTFHTAEQVSPAAILPFLGQLSSIFPVAPTEVSWQMPAFNSAAVQLQIGPMGATSVAPDFVVGASPRGWNLQLSSRQLVVRHQQTLKSEPSGLQSRQSDLADFPGVEVFCGVTQAAISLLPAMLVENVRLVSITANYVIPCLHTYPGSVIADQLLGTGVQDNYVPRDDRRYLLGVQEQSFETVGDQRFVWNNITRMARWFGAEGHLLQNSAISKSLEIHTALPEPLVPTVNAFPFEAMPAIPPSRIQEFFGAGVEGALPRAIARMKKELGEGVAFNV